MRYIIGIDIGTSNTKAIAFDLKGHILAEHKISYAILNPEPTHMEQDINLLFNAAIRCIGEVVKDVNSKYTSNYLLGISFSAAMHGLIAMDARDEALTNCIIWADTRSEAFATGLKQTALGHSIYMNTGTPIHPMSPLCKLGWLKAHQPAIFEIAAKYISVKEYIFFQLFGKYVIDESIASATGLFNIHTRQWHIPSLELVHIQTHQLSDIVPITHMLTGMKAHYAQDMGISPDTPFIIGGSDGCLSNLGVNAIQPGNAAVTIGTSGAIRILSEQPLADEKERTFSYVLTESKFILGGAVNSGGVILNWFKDHLLAPKASNKQQSEPSFQEVLTEASSVPAGAEGLIFLPYLMGERAPHWHADAKGMFFGIQLHHQHAHFARSVLEGIIFGLYSVGKALEETTGPINVIYANGGFAQSDFWVQMLSDIFNKEVRLSGNIESSAMGAFIIALKTLSHIQQWEEAIPLIPIQSIYTPNQEQHALYMKNFQLFEQLYDRVKDLF